MSKFGQFKSAQREKTLRVLRHGVTIGGVVWNLIYYSVVVQLIDTYCTSN